LSGSAQDVALPTDSEPNGILSLGDVLALTLVRNPELSAYSYETRRGRRRSSKRSFANPELGVSTEEFGGTGEARGFEGAETPLKSVSLSNLPEKDQNAPMRLSLIRSWRIGIIRQSRLDVFTEAAKAFVEVLAAQERVALAEQLNKLAAEVNILSARGSSPVKCRRWRIARRPECGRKSDRA